MWLYGYTVCNKHCVPMSTNLQKAGHMYELSCCCWWWCRKERQNARGTFWKEEVQVVIWRRYAS